MAKPGDGAKTDHPSRRSAASCSLGQKSKAKQSSTRTPTNSKVGLADAADKANYTIGSTHPSMVDRGNGSTTISIRHYQPADQERVHEVFAAGIMSNLNAAVVTLFQSPAILGLSAILIGISHWISGSVVVPAFLGCIMVGFIYCFSRLQFASYIKECLQDDLSNIPNVYNRKQGGFFLVAIDDSTGTIVGTVGLEPKGQDLYELRRMSVDAQYQGKGIGRRLLQRLDQECQKGKITLGTSKFMYAAQALYQRNGFVLTKRTPLVEKGIHKYFSNLELWSFEKQL